MPPPRARSRGKGRTPGVPITPAMHPQPQLPAVYPVTPELQILENRTRWWQIALPPVTALTVLLLLGGLVTRQGPAVTPDSVQYLSAAHHVARGEGVTTSITELTTARPRVPFAAWPPLLPVGLGLLMKEGVSPFIAPRILNLFCLALSVFALGWVAREAGGTGAASATLYLYAVCFYPVLIAGFVWSEPLYVALSLLSLGFVGRGLRSRGRFPWALAAAGALAGGTMLTRYIGFTLIAATAAGLWLLLLHRSPRALAAGLAAYLVPAGLLGGGWLLRNRLETGYFFGEARPEAWFGWDRVLADAGRSLWFDWTGPIARHPGPAAAILAGAGALGALVILGYLVSRLRLLRFTPPDSGGGLAFVLWLYVVAFLLGMIFLSRTVGFDPLNTRYLAPCYPAALVLAVMVARYLSGVDRRRPPGNRARNLVATALVLLALPQLAATATLVLGTGHEERTVSYPYWTSTQWDDPAWDADPGLARAETLARTGIVVSNLWDLVGIRSGGATKALPEVTWPGYPERLWDLPGAVIAVNRTLRPYRATVEDLRRLAAETGRLEPLGDTGDWTFFRILDGPGRGRVS